MQLETARFSYLETNFVKFLATKAVLVPTGYRNALSNRE